MEETAKLGGIAELAKKIHDEEGRRLRILDVGCGIGVFIFVKIQEPQIKNTA